MILLLLLIVIIITVKETEIHVEQCEIKWEI